jgi:hypothetical protein
MEHSLEQKIDNRLLLEIIKIKIYNNFKPKLNKNNQSFIEQSKIMNNTIKV